MILDVQNLFDDAKDFNGIGAGNYVSTNAIDLWGSAAAPSIPQGGTVIKDMGRTPVELLCQVITTFTSGGAPTLQIQLIGATASDLTTGQLVYTETAALLALATLVAGYKFRVAIPPGITLRYLGLRYVVLTAAYTAGKLTSGITFNDQTMPFVG